MDNNDSPFNRVFRGYDPDEVNLWMKGAKNKVAELQKQNDDLQEKALVANDAVSDRDREIQQLTSDLHVAVMEDPEGTNLTDRDRIVIRETRKMAAGIIKQSESQASDTVRHAERIKTTAEADIKAKEERSEQYRAKLESQANQILADAKAEAEKIVSEEQERQARDAEDFDIALNQRRQQAHQNIEDELEKNRQECQARVNQADQYIAEAEKYSADIRSEADSYSATTRNQADQYDMQTRDEADRYKQECVAAGDDYILTMTEEAQSLQDGLDKFAEEVSNLSQSATHVSSMVTMAVPDKVRFNIISREEDN